MPLAGVVIAGLAIGFGQFTNKSYTEVLFSGQSALPGLVENAASWSVGALVLLVVFKGLAYAISLSAFRGGPTFPGMFIGAVGGLALSHLPGLPAIAGVGMGIGALTAVMLGLPFTSVLLVAIFLQADAIALTPLVIVAVAVAYVAAARIAPVVPGENQAAPAPPVPVAG